MRLMVSRRQTTVVVVGVFPWHRGRMFLPISALYVTWIVVRVAPSVIGVTSGPGVFPEGIPLSAEATAIRSISPVNRIGPLRRSRGNRGGLLPPRHVSVS